MSVVAAHDRVSGAIVASTASSFVTLSFDPPLAMFAIQHNVDSYASIESSKFTNQIFISGDHAIVWRTL